MPDIPDNNQEQQVPLAGKEIKVQGADKSAQEIEKVANQIERLARQLRAAKNESILLSASLDKETAEIDRQKRAIEQEYESLEELIKVLEERKKTETGAKGVATQDRINKALATQEALVSRIEELNRKSLAVQLKEQKVQDKIANIQAEIAKEKARQQREQIKQQVKQQRTQELKKLKQGTAIKGIAGALGKGSISGAATGAAQLAGTLSPEILAATGAISAVAGAVALVGKVSLDAAKNSTSYAQSLQATGKALSSTEQRSLRLTNNLNKLSNQASNLLQLGGDLLNIVLEPLVGLLEGLTGGLGSQDPAYKREGAIAGVSTSAMQSGFSLSSANALGAGTYGLAQQLAPKYGEQAYDVAEKLADAWLTGSDAAKQYGVVVNDNVLAGYMASQGIDIVNTEITEAMRQYYRYQLLTEEVNASSKEAMQQQIKQWTQLGLIIDKTKGKLFSFDEVINLEAFDPTIPEVTGSLYEPIEKPEQPETPPVNPSLPEPPDWLKNLALNPMTLPIAISILGMEKVAELQAALEALPQSVTSEVKVPVLTEVPYLAQVLQLQSLLLGLPASVAVQVLAEVLNLGEVESYKALLEAIPQTVASIITATVPGLNLVQTLSNLVTYLNGSFNTNLNVSVAGQELLDRAAEVFSEITQLAAELGLSGGLSTETGVSRTSRSWAGSGVTLGTPAVAKGGKGVQLPTITPGVVSSEISAYLPTSSIQEQVYGTGIGGALAADLDMNLARLGLKSGTKSGISGSQLRQATGEFIGYNADPSKSGGLAQNLIATAGAGLLGSSILASSPAAMLDGLVEGLGLIGRAGLGAAGLAFADGGIGTKEVHNATLFEGDQKEAVIPLESQEGIDYLAQAMQKAGGTAGGAPGNNITVNLSLEGLNVAESQEAWQRVAEQIAEQIDILLMRRGELNYGSSF